MSSFAPILQAFFTDGLARQRQASAHTIRAYRDTFRLLLRFAHQQTGKPPARLDLTDIDAPLITAFLDHLEQTRHNTARTRNARMAAIRSLYRFASYREPGHAALIQRVLAIPDKRTRRTIVSYLNATEIDALLNAVDRGTWLGRRDHALLVTAIQTGLRVSELCGLRRSDLTLTTGPHVRCQGKGRKDRCTPLTRTTVAVLKTWLAETADGDTDPVFPTRTGSPLKPDSIGDLLDRHTTIARQQCQTWTTERVTPHTLRHTAAMQLLHAGVDTSTIRYGSATNTSKQPRSTSTVTSPSNRKHSTAPHHPTPNQAATDHPTRSSPSSKASNYPGPTTPQRHSHATSTHEPG